MHVPKLWWVFETSLHNNLIWLSSHDKYIVNTSISNRENKVHSSTLTLKGWPEVISWNRNPESKNIIMCQTWVTYLYLKHIFNTKPSLSSGGWTLDNSYRVKSVFHQVFRTWTLQEIFHNRFLNSFVCQEPHVFFPKLGWRNTSTSYRH